MNSHPIAKIGQAANNVATRVADSANELGASVLSASHALRGQVGLAGERGTRYVRDEPLKSVLIAVAAGATLAALLGWLTQSSRSSRR